MKELPLLKIDSLDDKKVASSSSTILVKLHPFDPNQVSYQELLTLGLSEKTARIFIKFRSKGFVFRKKEDLQKVYGISKELYLKLEPYQINTNNAEKKTEPNSTANKITNTAKIELNTADSLSLLEINGIGPAFAKRILKYRNLLGGYSSVEQLKEVYGLNDEVYSKIKEQFSVNPSLISKINLNKDDFKTINKHPYISYEITKAIFNQRRSIPITPEVLKEILNDPSNFSKLEIYINY